MQRFKITKEGYEKMKNELERLVTEERPAISKAIGEAIELGDLSENAEYSSAKEKQSIIETTIALYSERIANADVIDLTKIDDLDFIDFGATVVIEDLDTEVKKKYKLVSEFESDLDSGLISIESLVGKALVGKKVGDQVEIKTPAGVKEYEILELIYK